MHLSNPSTPAFSQAGIIDRPLTTAVAAAECRVPSLSSALQPPLVFGAATLTTAAMHGAGLPALCALVQRAGAEPAGLIYDTGLVHQIAFRPDEARRFQAAALDSSSLFRVRRATLARVQGKPLSRTPVANAPCPGTSGPAPVRVLALMSPGDLMANTPLDFVTNHLDVQLDLLFMRPGQALPETVPEHDVMICASSEPDPATLDAMSRLYQAWPRPVLNNPACLPLLARDRLPAVLGDIPGLLCPATAVVAREGLEAAGGGRVALEDVAACGGFPVLVRPVGSHAGIGLEKVEGPDALAAYLRRTPDAQFYVTEFVDYGGADGLFRKYRVGFIEGEAFLCHMAASEHWMVHYLNAGMAESPAKRALEAEAMAGFDAGFGARHAAAFRALHAALGFDFYSLDCGELPDGRLLVFEADQAAIIHLMDPVDLFPYKHVQMRRVFTAFEAMLRRRTGLR
ncbi:MAG: ATP-grasp domain-containing protein [Janthinobacterium lividum]